MLSSNPTIRASLSHSAIFSQLGDDVTEAILAHSRVVRYAARSRIFVKGDPGDSMMIVLRGRVVISTPSPDGRQLVLSTLGPGEIFGEIAMIDGMERTAAAAADTVSEVLVIPRRTFLSLMERRIDVCMQIIRVLCQRLRQADNQVEDLAFLDLDVRLARTLLLLESGGAPIRISQQALGELVGGSRARVNRHLSAWRSQGIVSVRGGEILILDRASLALHGMSNV